QQQLVALQVRQRLAEQLVDRQPEKAKELVGQLQADTTTALADLRDLARGIYPPLLADEGLVAALEAQARRVPVPVHIEAAGVERYPQEIEAAVYFSTLEALQNTAKYADADSATVTLAEVDGSLTFSITDDGAGFDPGVIGRGTGLQGIEDRLGALDGRLTVASSPGTGTVVTGSIGLNGAVAVGRDRA
ncbi:MAG TPA: ATP-binding protein, partial [Actinomycetota bacterium]|nr:ATP-binding protein [Actinomycetota bacterium]